MILSSRRSHADIEASIQAIYERLKSRLISQFGYNEDSAKDILDLLKQPGFTLETRREWCIFRDDAHGYTILHNKPIT